MFDCLFESLKRGCLTYAGDTGTDKSLLTGHHALLLRQMASDLLHTYYHTDMIIHGMTLDKPASGTDGTSR